MPDEVVTPVPSPSQPSTPPASPGFTIPEKFAGKSLEDVAKSYVELESKYGETSGKLKALDDYTKIGSAKDIVEIIEYAQNAKRLIDQGVLVPRDQARAKESSNEPAKAPWEEPDWVYKSPQEQFAALNDRVIAQNKSYIDSLASQYGQQINALSQQDAKQKSILLKAITAAIKNPTFDPETILTQAAELSAKSPEDLINMVLEAQQNGPDQQEKRISEEVAKRQAEWIQQQQAKELASFNSSTTLPRGLGARVNEKNQRGAREQETKQIIDTLHKQGIRLL